MTNQQFKKRILVILKSRDGLALTPRTDPALWATITVAQRDAERTRLRQSLAWIEDQRLVPKGQRLSDDDLIRFVRDDGKEPDEYIPGYAFEDQANDRLMRRARAHEFWEQYPPIPPSSPELPFIVEPPSPKYRYVLGPKDSPNLDERRALPHTRRLAATSGRRAIAIRDQQDGYHEDREETLAELGTCAPRRGQDLPSLPWSPGEKRALNPLGEEARDFAVAPPRKPVPEEGKPYLWDTNRLFHPVFFSMLYQRVIKKMTHGWPPRTSAKAQFVLQHFFMKVLLRSKPWLRSKALLRQKVVGREQFRLSSQATLANTFNTSQQNISDELREFLKLFWVTWEKNAPEILAKTYRRDTGKGTVVTRREEKAVPKPESPQWPVMDDPVVAALAAPTTDGIPGGKYVWWPLTEWSGGLWARPPLVLMSKNGRGPYPAKIQTTYM